MTTAVLPPKVDRGFQALFRPMVQTAWNRHCKLFSLDPHDAIAKESWYRDALRAAAGIDTTKELDHDQQKRVLGHFAYLARGCDAKPAVQKGLHVNGWTDAQCARFTDLANKAWRIDRARRKDNIAPFGQWWEAEFARVLKGPPEGERSILTGGLMPWNHVKAFDAIMEHFGVIAQDEFWMRRASECSERRMRRQLALFLVDLAWIEGRYTVSWAYVRSIYAQSDLLPERLEDCPWESLQKVLAMLDTRIRKLCGRLKVPYPGCSGQTMRPCYLPSREPSPDNRDQMLPILWDWFHGKIEKRWPNGWLVEPDLGIHECGCAYGRKSPQEAIQCVGCGAERSI